VSEKYPLQEVILPLVMLYVGRGATPQLITALQPVETIVLFDENLIVIHPELLETTPGEVAE
jgi:hypothetical protein